MTMDTSLHQQRRAHILAILEQAVISLHSSSSHGPQGEDLDGSCSSFPAVPSKCTITLIQDNASSLPCPLSKTWRKHQGWCDMDASHKEVHPSMCGTTTTSTSSHSSRTDLMFDDMPSSASIAPPSPPKRQTSIGSVTGLGGGSGHCVLVSDPALAPSPTVKEALKMKTRSNSNSSSSKKKKDAVAAAAKKAVKPFQYPPALTAMEGSTSSLSLSGLASAANARHTTNAPPRRQDSNASSSSYSLPSMPQRQASDRSCLSKTSDHYKEYSFLDKSDQSHGDRRASDPTVSTAPMSRSSMMGDSFSSFREFPLNLMSMDNGSSHMNTAPHMPQRQDSVSTLGSRQSSIASLNTLSTQESLRSVTSLVLKPESSLASIAEGAVPVISWEEKEDRKNSVTNNEEDDTLDSIANKLPAWQRRFQQSSDSLLSSSSHSSSTLSHYKGRMSSPEHMQMSLSSDGGMSTTHRRSNMRGSFVRQETTLKHAMTASPAASSDHHEPQSWVAVQ